MKSHIPSIERLRELLEYDEQTGVVTNRTTRTFKAAMGKQAGRPRSDGYLELRVDGYRTKLHRIIWAMVYGELPRGVIDHINGIRTDNRLANLRDVSNTQNIQNQRAAHRRNRSSGLLGANFHKQSGRWQARIAVEGRRICLGLHATAEEAHEAYVQAKRRLHSTCTI